jgi:hypothetical protein
VTQKRDTIERNKEETREKQETTGITLVRKREIDKKAKRKPIFITRP